MRSRAYEVTKKYSIVIAIGVLYAVLCRFTAFRIECPFHTVTGLLCPGCGITRMLLALFEFKFAEAFRYNPVVFCILPILGFIKIKSSYQYIKFGKAKIGRFETVVIYLMLFALIIFGVLRNII